MVNLLGVHISPITKKELLARIEDTLSKSEHVWIITANPEILVRAYRDNAYRTILKQADVIVADGVGVVLAARLLYGARLERITGADLAEKILRIASNNQKKVFLLGGSDTVNQRAVKNVTRYTLHVTRVRGMGGEFTESKAIKEIAEYQPHILFVALGAPKQEIFIKDFLQAPNPKRQFPNIMVGIGGTIDFWARPSLRAPKMLQRIGLEWLWRLIRQLWRLKRIFNAVIVFPTICLYDFFQQKRAPRA